MQAKQYHVIRLAAFGIAILTFLLGLFLIWRYPIVYWDDAYTRLAFRDQVLVGRWLPAVQVLVFLTGKLPAGLVVLRVLLAGFAAGAVLAIYRYTADIFNPATGVLASTLLATHTLFIALAIVPYREILIVGLCFLILYFLEHADRPRHRAAAYGLIVLLSLTRYDAWLFVPVFILLEACRGLEEHGPRGAVRRGLTAAVILGATPVLWYFFGTYDVLEHEAGILERVASGEVGAFFASLLDHAWWRTRVDILVFGGVGAAVAYRDPLTRRHPLRILVLAALQFALLAVAGIWDVGNLRLTFFPTILLIPYAARGYLLAAGGALAALRRVAPALTRTRIPEWSLLAPAAAGFGLLLYVGAVFVAGAAHVPVYRAGYAAAEAFEGAAFTGVLVLTDAPVGPYVFASYSEVPLAAIYEIGPTTLDHGLHAVTPEALAAAGISHIVAVYSDEAGLSPEELELLDRLNSGEIAAERTITDGGEVWRLRP